MAADSGDPAGLLSKYWDAVRCYADLCTTTPEDGAQLATEAFARTCREAPPWTAPHFAWLPRLLTAVRNTAAEWYADGRGGMLDPGLRTWLDTEDPTWIPVALHGFQDMPEPDRSLLWHSQIELRPLVESAGLMGVSPARAEAEIQRTRELFRESCLRVRLHTLVDKDCRGYAKLLDVATRDPEGSALPEDLRRHLARCFDCSTAATDFALHGSRLATTLARGVLGWGSTGYLRSRQAAAAGRPPTSRARARAGIPRQHVALTLAALTVPALVLLGILLPSSDPGSPASVAAPSYSAVSLPAYPVDSPSGVSASPSVSATPTPKPPTPSSQPSSVGLSDTTTELPGQDSPSPTASKTSAAPSHSAASCSASYKLVNQWDGGFQAQVLLTSNTALNGWHLEWRFPDGQRITQMWNGTFTQSGARVSVTPADYNISVPAHQTLDIGFLGTWSYANGSPPSVSLNGAVCSG